MMDWVAILPLIALLLAAVTFSLGWQVRGKRRPAHPCERGHDFRPISAQSFDGFQYSTTVLLRRCTRCGSHGPEIYNGLWRIDEFVRTESDISELERMAR